MNADTDDTIEERLRLLTKLYSQFQNRVSLDLFAMAWVYESVITRVSREKGNCPLALDGRGLG